MTTIYAKSDASGANDGTSWTDAYTSLTTALSALSNGDTLYTDAPESAPWIGGYSITSRSNVSIITNAGPSGETWLTNKNTSTSWVESSGIWSIALGSEPSHVVYDFKRDDVLGTATGCDLTTYKNQRAIALYQSRRPLSINDCRAWYGFLRDGGATTTPAEGEYGYTGGNLYINPPGTPDKATVDSLAGYMGSADDALDLISCSDCVVRGRLLTVLYPNVAGNAGYGLVGTNSTRNTLSGHVGIACGWHSAGHNSNSTDDNRLSDCISIGSTGQNWIENPYVFFSTNTSSGHVGTGLVHIATGLLDVDGKPLGTAHQANTMYSHTGGVGTIQVAWQDVLTVDFHEQLEAKHTITLSGQGRIAAAGNAPSITNPLDANDYACTVTRAIGVGKSAKPGGRIGFTDCVFDRGGMADSASADLTINSHVAMKNCLVITGDLAFGWFRVDNSGYGLFDGVTFIVDNSGPTDNTRGVFSINTGSAARLLFKGTCRFLAGDGLVQGIIARTNAPSYWDAGILAVTSDGTNLFEDGEWDTETLHHSNPGVTARNAAWWKANIAGGSTDDFNWVADQEAVERAFFIAEWGKTNSIDTAIGGAIRSAIIPF